MAKVAVHTGAAQQMRVASRTLATSVGSSIALEVDANAGDVGVQFGRVSLVIVWLGVYSFHAICAGCLVIAARVYWEMPSTTVAGMFEMYKIALDKKYLKAIGAVHYALGAIHLYILAKALLLGVYVVAVPERVQVRITNFQEKLHRRVLRRLNSKPASHRTKKFRGFHSHLRAILRTVFRSLFARDGLFGVESRHYELIFLLREVIETILQSNQAYNMSRLLPRARLNRFYVVILIVNCWATPLLHHAFRNNRSRQLLLCLLCDIVLDFVSSIGVPFVLALTYIEVYDKNMLDYDPMVWYDDKWLINIMNETPLIFCNSWLDLGSRILFLLSLLASMEDVRSLIRPRASAGVVPTVPPLSRVGSMRRNSISGVGYRGVHLSRFVKWVHCLLVAYGFAIFGAFLHSEFKPSPSTCVLELRPWLVSRPACALIEINCLTDPTRTADRADFEAATKSLDPGSLEHIVIRHCPTVEFTPRLQTFTNLLGIKIYNSTLKSWNATAALTATHHERIRFAYFPYTTFPNDTLPAGLLSMEFPQSLRDLRVAVSNIRWIPDNLHERWPLGLTVMFELTQLDYFPVTLTKLQPWFLSLMGNAISSYPREALQNSTIHWMMMNGNPISALPESIDSSRIMALESIFLDNTNLSTIPRWMDEAFLNRVYVRAGHTPICRDILHNPNSTEGKNLVLARPWLLTRLDCREFENMPMYRLDLEVRNSEVW